MLQLFGVGVNGFCFGAVAVAVQLGPQLCGRGDRLACDGAVGNAVEKCEVVQERVVAEVQFPGQADAFGAGVHAVKVVAAFHLLFFNPVEAPHEVKVPPGAAEFAVGNALQPLRPLAGDEFPDFAVFSFAQAFRGKAACFPLPARLFQGLRAQKAAYDVCPERGQGS